MELYRVAVEVCPLPCHPRYWEWGACWLCVWVFDDSRPAAAEQAFRLVKASAVFGFDDSTPQRETFVSLAATDTDPRYLAKVEEACQVGFAFQVHVVPVGVDEELPNP